MNFHLTSRRFHQRGRDKLQFLKVFSKPIGKFTLNIYSFRQDQWFSNKIFFSFQFLKCFFLKIMDLQGTPF